MLLDVQALLGAFPDLRESSFIDNDRVPLERIRPASRLLIMPADKMQRLVKDGSYAEVSAGYLVLPTEDSNAVASERELLALKEHLDQQVLC
jgi:hypothetical protein